MSKINKHITIEPRVLEIFKSSGLKNFSQAVSEYFISLEDEKSFLVSKIDVLNSSIEALKFDIERLESERSFFIKKLKKLNSKEGKNEGTNI